MVGTGPVQGALETLDDGRHPPGVSTLTNRGSTAATVVSDPNESAALAFTDTQMAGSSHAFSIASTCQRARWRLSHASSTADRRSVSESIMSGWCAHGQVHTGRGLHFMTNARITNLSFN